MSMSENLSTGREKIYLSWDISTLVALQEKVLEILGIVRRSLNIRNNYGFISVMPYLISEIKPFLVSVILHVTPDNISEPGR